MLCAMSYCVHTCESYCISNLCKENSYEKLWKLKNGVDKLLRASSEMFPFRGPANRDSRQTNAYAGMYSITPKSFMTNGWMVYDQFIRDKQINIHWFYIRILLIYYTDEDKQEVCTIFRFIILVIYQDKCRIANSSQV